jgi:hypothetical protein
LAKKEEAALESKSDSVPEWAKENAIRRDEMLRHCFFYSVGILIILGAFLLGAALAIWGFHLLAPQSWRWLSPIELEKLQVLIFSGAVSALATVVTKRVFGTPG